MYRPEKLSDLETIIYEIDMIEYSYQKLVKERRASKREGYVFLECFLLHYRNLIDFFGKSPSLLRNDDLSVSKPEDWAGGSTISEAQVKSMFANEVYEEYEGRDETGKKRRDTISRYLQHCTKQRTESKDWPVEKMYSKLSPLIDAFRRSLGDWRHVAIDDGEFIVGPSGAHTATVRKFKSW